MRAPILSTFSASTESRRRAHRIPHRSLRMESLERRWVFSAAPVAEVNDAGACLPEPELPAVAEGSGDLAAPAVGPAYPAAPSYDTLLTPAAVPVDQVLLTWEDGAEGEGGTQYSYYLHLDMTSVPMGNFVWNFSGRVYINGPVGNVTVHFGGLLQGHSTGVDSNGQFSYNHQFTEGTMGQVTAQAKSSLGYLSNTDTEFVMA